MEGKARLSEKGKVGLAEKARRGLVVRGRPAWWGMEDTVGGIEKLA